MSADGHMKIGDADLSVHPLAGRIGAEIGGVRLSGDLSRPAVEAIRAALVKHKVIFFREQGHLDEVGQEAFAALLGEPVAHPFLPVLEGTEHILELDYGNGMRANTWHTDMTFTAAYPQAVILRSVVVPEYGGDTVWANAAAAYQDLPGELRDLADNLWAIHSSVHMHRPVTAHDAITGLNASGNPRKSYDKEFAATIFEVEHPVVRVHPENGERSLVLGSFLRLFRGFSLTASNQLWELLQGYVTRLENTVRWRWRADDVAIWDNRATQHYALADYDDQPRVMRRLTVAGDVPVSVDRRRSRAISVPAGQSPGPRMA